MNYWLDLFTGITWEEFQKAGANITGFREHNKKRAAKIRPGDIFLCYLTGVSRWVGLLEVTGQMFEDKTPIWAEEVFPIRCPVKPIVILKPEHGVQMEELKGKLSFFQAEMPPGRWSGLVRGSPTRYEKADGEVISAAIREAEANPFSRPVDPRKLKRSSNLYKLHKKVGDEEIETVVAIPSEEEEEETEVVTPGAPTHTEIQWRLLDLGSRMGLNVWAPRNDRGRNWNGKQIAEIPGLLESLPVQFEQGTHQTIERMDVIWLNGKTFVAAFEVEHTTSIYSGLLRMSDLLYMQANIDIKLYLVAPDERYEKFTKEVSRPTFASSNKPLHTICSFLPYSRLCERLEEVKNVIHYLKPEFIDEISEYYDPAEDYGV
ncbi:MAG TPA: hypothetical protein VIH42_00770 [Thermoguttaceae bacterium]